MSKRKNTTMLSLAREPDRRRIRKTVIELQRATDALTRKDIRDWRDAWQVAINVENPNRQRLYDIYRDVEVYLHLSECVEQRTGFVIARSFKVMNAADGEDEKALHYFDQAWFKQLLRYALESVYWGHSLVELGEVITDADGCPCYSDVTLIPQKYVTPKYGRVIRDTGQEWTEGIPYRELKEYSRLEQMMKSVGLNQYMIAGTDTEIEFVESSRGDAYNIYDKRIDRANSELSKLIIGQTMTIKDGSTLSQSETHLEVFQNLVESDCDMFRDTVNNQLIPRMIRHGFPLKGLRFDWDYAVDYTPEQQKAYEEMVLAHYKVDPAYFEEKYGMPCSEKPDTPELPEPNPKQKEGEDPK